MCNISNFIQMTSVPEQRSTAHIRLLLSSRPEKGLLSDFRAKCRHQKWRLQQAHLKNRTSTSPSLTCGQQTALILVQWIMLFVVPSATSLSHTKIYHGGRTEETDNHRVATFHWQLASMSGVGVLNVLWRMAVDISNTAIFLELSLIDWLITVFIK